MSLYGHHLYCRGIAGDKYLAFLARYEIGEARKA